MNRELNDEELENVLGGADKRAVEERLQNGNTNAFRDMFLEDKFREMREKKEGHLSNEELENVLGGADKRAVEERLQNGNTNAFRDMFLEDKFREMRENEEKGRTR